MALPAVLMAIGAPIAIALIMSAGGPLFNWIMQSAYGVTPNMVIDAIGLINLKHRGIIDDTRYIEEMQKSGFNSERADLLFQGSETLLNGYDIVSSWRREAISEAERDKQLHSIGYTDGKIKQILSVSEAIPSARDIIAFAVREVYSPEIATQFGQYEGASEVYATASKDLQAAGMPEETFKKFWAAHWMLPSMTQGYEMLHRRIIESADLDRLMVALDIMPWWRDKLRAMSYHPLTRVDVRRMHKIGVLSDEDLPEAYQDLGYDEEKAIEMSKFTILYNFGPEAAEMTPEDRQKEAQKEASRGAIIKSYKQQYLERNEALMYIEEIGYSPDAAELYVMTADLDMEEDVINKHIDTIHDQYVRRLITREDALGKVGNLNLPGRKQDALIANWDVERDSRTSRPSKSEVFKWYKLKLIGEGRLMDELEGLGYTQNTIDMYLKMIKAEGG